MEYSCKVSYILYLKFDNTVNVVILDWGEISRKCWQDISHEGNFHETTPISFIKAYGFILAWG